MFSQRHSEETTGKCWERVGEGLVNDLGSKSNLSPRHNVVGP